MGERRRMLEETKRGATQGGPRLGAGTLGDGESTTRKALGWRRPGPHPNGGTRPEETR